MHRRLFRRRGIFLGVFFFFLIAKGVTVATYTYYNINHKIYMYTYNMVMRARIFPGRIITFYRTHRSCRIYTRSGISTIPFAVSRREASRFFFPLFFRAPSNSCRGRRSFPYNIYILILYLYEYEINTWFMRKTAIVLPPPTSPPCDREVFEKFCIFVSQSSFSLYYYYYNYDDNSFHALINTNTRS